MDDKTESNQVILTQLIQQAKENFYPILQRELHTQLAKEYKLRYDCYRKEGFTMVEALRLTVGYYD